MTELAWAAAQIAQRRPGHALPQALYADPRAYDFDLEAIFAQNWFMAALECELPEPGSTFAFTIGASPVLLVRDKGGEIRAFHNTCRHRGSILCHPGHGQAARLVCPYHRWTYGLDGALLAAGRMPEGFDKGGHGLREVALRRVAGALFVCLAETPPDFDDFAARFEAYAGPLDFGSLKLAASDVLVEEANWKLVMENARECYHCPTGHPELAASFPVHFTRHFDGARNPAAPAFAQAMDAAGLAHEPVEGPWWQLARFALNPGSRSISPDGQPVCARPLTTLNGGDVGSLRWAIDPHLFAHATGDHVFVFSCIPVAPRETHVLSRWYVRKDAVEGVDYELPRLTELWLKTNAQDKELAENNHRGVLSAGYLPGPYSPEAEALVARFTDWYCDRARDYVAAHD